MLRLLNRLTLIDGRRTRRVRKRHTEDLKGTRHGVGTVPELVLLASRDARRHIREHASAATGTRTRVADNIEPLLLADFTCDVCTVGLERIDSGHVIARLGAKGRAVDVPLAGLDSATVDDNRGTVVAHSSHETARHVFITSEKWRCEMNEQHWRD